MWLSRDHSGISSWWLHLSVSKNGNAPYPGEDGGLLEGQMLFVVLVGVASNHGINITSNSERVKYGAA